MAIVKAGQEVDSWCTKCRLDLLHRVVAAVGGQPKRVECKTCHSQHNYRAPKGSGVAAATRTTTKKKAAPRTRRSGSSGNSSWIQLVAGKDTSKFVPYDIATRFVPDQLVNHKKFGDGCVTSVLDDQKITVLFRDGEKTLIHNRGRGPTPK